MWKKKHAYKASAGIVALMRKALAKNVYTSMGNGPIDNFGGKMKKIAAAMFVSIFMLVGCATPANTVPQTQAGAAAPAALSPEPGVRLYFDENAQVELISPQGVRVMIDVTYETRLSSPPTADDILVTTDWDMTHYYIHFADKFPGRQSELQSETITRSDVTITGISSKHLDKPETAWGTAYIYVIEMGGLRIAHFGASGLSPLTDDQMKALGRVDIAIMELVNETGSEEPISGFDLENKKAFRLVDQIKPKLVIPSTYSMKGVEYASKLWGGYAYTQNPIVLTPASLPGSVKLLVMGMMAKSYQSLYQLDSWGGAVQQ
jgi:hypothetical protein